MSWFVAPNGGLYSGDFPEKGSVLIANRPSIDHLLQDNWQSDPMNPSVCWAINLVDHKARKRQAINAAANRRIINYYGVVDGKQANMLKRGLALTRKRAMLVVFTPAETSEEGVLLQAMQYIDDVRAAARAAKQAVADATNVSGVDAVTVNWPIGTPPDWPL